MLSKVYKEYIFEKINWNKFCEVSDTIDQMNVADISLLEEIFLGKVKKSNQCASYKIGRLSALGLIETTINEVRISNMNNSNTINYINLSEFGKEFCTLIKELFEKDFLKDSEIF